MASKIQKIFQSVRERLPSQSYASNKSKVINAISLCRTPQMGGFVQRCNDCGHTEAHFHSCRNRHCPICQGSQQERWVERQVANTLPLQYFHVVFTLPAELNSLFLANPVVLYNLLFQAASSTLLTLAKNENFLGAQAGFTTVLHTWGRNLQFHPHLHCIVAGGGLSTDSKRFICSKESFFLPVRAMKKVFRGKFLEQLKNLFVQNQLKLPHELASISHRHEFLDRLYSMDWIVYCKKPFKNSSHVIRYLGRYTHKVAITDGRIVSYDTIEQKVRFKWKDYKDSNRLKIMELSDEEFVRRFLLHVLPSSFMKIRHYGFLANKNRDKRLERCRALLKALKQNLSTVFSVKPKPQARHYCPDCGSSAFVVVFSSPRHQPTLLPTGTGP